MLYVSLQWFNNDGSPSRKSIGYCSAFCLGFFHALK
nr:MAG TPA: hypothetical protein [Caudoviricetes sp.]